MTIGTENMGRHKNRIVRIGTVLILILVFITMFSGCGNRTSQDHADPEQTTTVTEQKSDAEDTASGDIKVDEKGVYDSKDEVSAYIVAFGKLPENYITKKEARQLGWEGGSVEEYAPGMCIGGDRFGNYERSLPDDEYLECDIDTLGEDSRGAKRLVYSDEAVYYTEDHYRNFEKVCNR